MPDDYPMAKPSSMGNTFMARAIQLAVENVRSGRGGPFGCVIVQDTSIIAEAANRVTANCDPTAHAEILAIRLACERLTRFELTGCDLYSSCEPCPMCLSAVYWARIDRVYFGTFAEDAAQAGFDDSVIYREIAQPRFERKIPMLSMMRDEAIAAFQAWKESPGKIGY